jgi:hypothetical protein
VSEAETERVEWGGRNWKKQKMRGEGGQEGEREKVRELGEGRGVGKESYGGEIGGRD